MKWNILLMRYFLISSHKLLYKIFLCAIIISIRQLIETIWNKLTFKEFENLSVEKKTLSTARGFEPRSFDCRLTVLTTELHRRPTFPLLVRAVDRQSKYLGSNPSAVESVFYSTKRFSNSLNIEFICIYLRYKSLKLSRRTPVDNLSYLIRD